MRFSDTIFAVATGSGRAAVAVIRLSGPSCGPVLDALAGRRPEPRVAMLATLRDPRSCLPLDRGLVLWFPAPHSFTGEDGAELQLHGSRAVLQATLDALAALPGCRAAEPGEFTRRAFLNGKLDLPAVEGLADLIDAQTEAQRRQALRQLDGVLGLWAEDLRARLVEAMGLAEAAIDFADEGDIGSGALAESCREAGAVYAAIEGELARPRCAERVRDGFVVTLSGAPNAGKSTLLNALARRDVAIVSPHAGTTRDPIEVELDLGGYPVIVVDTAGLRDSTDPVEQEGIARARARAEAADLVLWLLAPGADSDQEPPPELKRIWRVATKRDLDPTCQAQADVAISAETGEGLDVLVSRIGDLVARESTGGEEALVTRLRHRTALERTRDHLARIGGQASDPELVAEELRGAAAALGELTGRIDTEEVLGAIFARFCIGK